MRVVAADQAGIHEAVEELRAGRLIALPTETVYGLGADAGNRGAVQAIYSIKGRPAGHPLIVHVADKRQAAWWSDWNPRAERLARAFWPGPLTLVLPRAAHAPAWACGDQASIGLRCPSHPVALAVLSGFALGGGRGVAAPSANRFGRISPTRAAHVAEDLAGEDVLVLDGGPCEVGLESTIIDLSRGRPMLLRPGGIEPAAIEVALGEPLAWSSNVSDPAVPDPLSPRASGTLPSHYAPRTPMRVLAGEWFGEALVDAALARQRVVLCATEPIASEFAVFPAVARVLTISVDPAEQARSLYATLREADAAGADRILYQAPPSSGAAWLALRDRLARAAAGGETPGD